MKSSPSRQEDAGGQFYQIWETLRSHPHRRDKTKFVELCLFQKNGHTYWMTELRQYEMMQIDSHRMCQHVVVNVKK